MPSTFDCEQPSSSEVKSDGENPLTWINWANLGAYVLNCGMTYFSLTGIIGETNTVLSKKYQTIITPAGWAFSIWGIIFMSEAAFTVAQMLPQWRGLPSVHAMAPWWWAACGFQVLWSIVFAQDWITFAGILMFCILVSLFGLLWVGDSKRGSISEYWLARAPFSLQAGWIIAASVLNLNVVADAQSASQATLLALAMVSFGLVLTAASLATFALPVPNPIICFVAFWALMGIHSELGVAENLKSEARFNYSVWPPAVLEGVRTGALWLAMASLALMVVAASLRLMPESASKAREMNGEMNAQINSA